MISNPSHELTLGSLILTGGTVGDATFVTLADSASFGSPQPVVVGVRSLLQDGTIVAKTGDDNREAFFRVIIEGTDLAAVAEAEQALVFEVGKRNQLTWTPPDGFGPPTVFEVLTSRLDPVFDDLDELLLRRTYGLTLTLLPFGHSVDPVTVTATPSAASPTVLDAGSATTNWGTWTTYKPGNMSITAATVSGESVINYQDGSEARASYLIEWTGATPAQAYVGLRVLHDAALKVRAYDANGVASDPVSVETTGALTTFYFENPGTASLMFSAGPVGGFAAAGADVYVDALVGSSGVGQSALINVALPGSVRAPASVSLSRASTMSWVTLFADPAMADGAYSPSVQGSWKNAPAGTYAFWMDRRTGDEIRVTITDSGGRTQVLTTTAYGGLSVIHPELMPVGEITVGGDYDGLVGTLTVSEVWIDGAVVAGPTMPRLFRKAPDTALVSIVATAYEYVIENPSIERPFGGVWADGKSVAALCAAWDEPIVSPPVTPLFVEGSGSTADPITTTATAHPHWHTSAAS